MPKPKRTTAKTERILKIYHLFITCDEVSRQEIRQSLGSKWDEKKEEWVDWNEKTISRDIAILKQAGIPIRYSGKQKAFVLSDNPEGELPEHDSRRSPTSPVGKKEQKYIDKIKRLTRFMNHLIFQVGEDDPCDLEYKKLFPEISKRTMQRDIITLTDLGYEITYKRKWDFSPAERTYESCGETYIDFERPVGHYYFELMLQSG